MPRLALRTTGVKRRQMLTIVIHTILIPLCISAFFVLCAFTWLWPLILLYLLFIWLDPRAESGANLSPVQQWFRNARWWKWFAEYYPVVLHKTVDLKPCFEHHAAPEDASIKGTQDIKYVKTENWFVRAYGFAVAVAKWWFYTLTGQDEKWARPTGQRYIFGYHPHGIIGMGVVGGVATDGAFWNTMFPGIPVRLLTIANNFRIPLYREYLLGAGIASVSKASCLRLLRKGNPICIVIGGARESLLAQPGKMDLILSKRFGFVKIALQTGASMVPVVGFGETDIFKQATLDQGFGASMHLAMTRNFGYTIPLFHARGIFNYDKGIIPYRRPIHVVVGEPVAVPLVPNPTNEQVQHYHALYVEQLQKLYETNKPIYWPEGGDLILTDAPQKMPQELRPSQEAQAQDKAAA